MPSLHDFQATLLNGQPVPLSQYAGQAVLVVNTASLCGFTPQYAALEALYQRYAPHGFTILAFPCDQFGHQEPGDAESIRQTCSINYGVTFPVFSKIDVNGRSAAPLYAWLTKARPGLLGARIRWNFTKFLLGRDGQPLRRYASFTKPEKLEPAIRRALGL